VGPYCSDDNHSIYLGAFTDRCGTAKADPSVYFDAYGSDLPYVSSSMASTTDWYSCQTSASRAGSRDAYSYSAYPLCQQLYENATARCETNTDLLPSSSPRDASGCAYIRSHFPLLEKAGGSGQSAAPAALVAWAVGVAAAASLLLRRRATRRGRGRRGVVDLSAQEGGAAA
jgi:hypothetical protein